MKCDGNNLKILNGEEIKTILERKEPDRVKLDEKTKIELIESKFREIMEVLGLDISDDGLKGTPRRVARMYVKEIFSGLNPDTKPKISLFKKEYVYNQMILEKDITIYSYCEHHFVPIIGKAHIAYFPNGNIIGLSKLNRIVQYYAKRPQVQERLTSQIAKELMGTLKTRDVAVFIEADHLCIKSRGIKDVNSKTITTEYNGKFMEAAIREEFINYIK
jgi:GTP cyclohydrolase I